MGRIRQEKEGVPRTNAAFRKKQSGLLRFYHRLQMLTQFLSHTSVWIDLEPCAAETGQALLGGSIPSEEICYFSSFKAHNFTFNLSPLWPLAASTSISASICE